MHQTKEKSTNTYLVKINRGNNYARERANMKCSTTINDKRLENRKKCK